MASKAQKRKEQKKVARKKRLERERNQRANRGRFRYILECEMKADQWKPVKSFKDWDGVKRHIEETEAIRKRGDTDIIPGRVLDLNNFNRVVANIKGYTQEKGPSMEEAAQDNLKKSELNIAQPVESGMLDAVSKCK